MPTTCWLRPTNTVDIRQELRFQKHRPLSLILRDVAAVVDASGLNANDRATDSEYVDVPIATEEDHREEEEGDGSAMVQTEATRRRLQPASCKELPRR